MLASISAGSIGPAGAWKPRRKAALCAAVESTPRPMVGEACAYVRGSKGLKAHAAFLVSAFQLPDRQRRGTKMRNILITAIAAMALTGCISAQQRAADQMSAARSASYTAYLQEIDDNNRCVSFGAQPGTSAYTRCRLQLAQMRANAIGAERDRQAAVAAQSRAEWAKHQQDMYDQQMANIRAIGQAAQTTSTAPKNCITNYVGGSAYTTCN